MFLGDQEICSQGEVSTLPPSSSPSVHRCPGASPRAADRRRDAAAAADRVDAPPRPALRGLLPDPWGPLAALGGGRPRLRPRGPPPR